MKILIYHKSSLFFWMNVKEIEKNKNTIALETMIAKIFGETGYSEE